MIYPFTLVQLDGLLCSYWFSGLFHPLVYNGSISFFLVVSSTMLNLGGLCFNGLIHPSIFVVWSIVFNLGNFFIYYGFHCMVYEWFCLGGNVMGPFVWFKHITTIHDFLRCSN
jgi:hypothetical protein